MKKTCIFLCVLLVLCMGIVLSACSSGNSEYSDTFVIEKGASGGTTISSE